MSLKDFWRKSAPAAADPAADPRGADQIAALAAVRTRDLVLPPDILAAYLSDTWSSRRKINIGWMIWAAAVNAACALVSLVTRWEDAAAVAGSSDVLTALIFSAGALWMSSLRRHGLEGSITILACAGALVVAGLAPPGPGGWTDHQIVQAIFLGGTGILMSRIPWRDTLVLSIVVVALATWLLLSDGGATVETIRTVIFYDAGLVGLALGKRVMKQLHHRVYVLPLNDRLRLSRIEEINSRLHDMARTDQLTGLPNRRHFDETLARLRAEGRPDRPIALIMIDIDFFKQLNDRFGHVAGDGCIAAVADLIRASLRGATDFVARFGGEEFIVLLPDVGKAGAAEIAERIRAAVEERRIENPASASGVLTVSAGVAAGRSSRLERLVADADAALYEAKSAGRNLVRVAPSPGGRHAA